MIQRQRRGPADRRQLVLDLGSVVTEGALVVPDTGALAQDLHLFATSLLSLLTGPNGALTRAVMGAAATDAELSEGLRVLPQPI